MRHVRLMMLLFLGCIIPYGCASSDEQQEAPEPRPHVTLPASLDTAQAFADEWIAEDPTAAWNWIDMVLMVGLWRLYEVGGDPEILDYVADFVDRRHSGYLPIASDWLSPAVLDLLVCEETGHHENCGRIPEYDMYFDTVNREQEAIVHWTGVENEDRQVWVDSIFMAGAYMIERARHLDEDAALSWWNDVATQFIAFDDILTDKTTGLMHHGYDFAEGTGLMGGADAFWGRGNSWYVAALGYTLRVLPDDHPDYSALAALWQARVNTLAPLQDDDGFWHTILDRPEDDYPETSATALIAYGFAAGLNAGQSHPDAEASVDAALQGLQASIEIRDGKHFLPQISGSTLPGTIEDYLNVPVRENIPYGIGAYLMLATETAILRGDVETPSR